MVFIKKYWYVILIIFLLICTTLGIFFLNKKWKNDKVETGKKPDFVEAVNNEVSVEVNDTDENKIEAIEDTTEQEGNEREVEIVESQEKVETNNQETSTTKQNIQTPKIEQPKEQSKPVPAESQVQEQKQETKVEVQEPQVQEQPVQQEPVQEPVIPAQPTENVVEYKENTAMINNIRNAINNNVSDDMRNYGYNIVVDSSIVNSTNQFTFSEKRVADKIKSKFGTIKIYARDYYLNGSYVWTECYVI